MNLFRKNIELMSAYVPGEQPRDGAYVKLNTNENPYPPSDAVTALLAGLDAASLRLYPDPLSRSLVSAAAKALGVGEECLLAGNGSDEILSMIMRAFVSPGDVVAYPFPTYVLYRTLAQIADARIVETPWNENYALPESLLPAGENAAVVFLCNPNSPSGTLVSTEEIRALVRDLAGLLVVDEAYVDFADENALGLTGDLDNVMILRTVSKAYSLAGLRLGFAVANPGLIAGMRKVKDSYNVSRLTQLVGEAALSDQAHMRANVERIKTTRARLAESLARLGFSVPPSQANFLWARHERIEARALYERLRRMRILVRVFSTEAMTDHVRITVGTDDEVNRLLAALAEILKN